MKHGKHVHSCQCEHDTIKYCSGCKVAYCVDCGEEWGKHYFSYSYTYPWSSITNATSTLSGSVNNYAQTETTSGCSHYTLDAAKE